MAAEPHGLMMTGDGQIGGQRHPSSVGGRMHSGCFVLGRNSVVKAQGRHAQESWMPEAEDVYPAWPRRTEESDTTKCDATLFDCMTYVERLKSDEAKTLKLCYFF